MEVATRWIVVRVQFLEAVVHCAFPLVPRPTCNEQPLVMSRLFSFSADRYMCAGDDLYFPSEEWDDDATLAENYETFLNFENLGVRWAPSRCILTEDVVAPLAGILSRVLPRSHPSLIASTATAAGARGLLLQGGLQQAVR